MDRSARLATCCGVLAGLVACGGGGSSGASLASASPSLARGAPPGLTALKDLGLSTYLAPTFGGAARSALNGQQDGGFALSWIVLGSASSNSSIQVQRFNSRGGPQGNVVSVILDRPLQNGGVASLRDGTMLVAFTITQDDYTGIGYETRALWLERFDKNANMLGAPQLVTSARNAVIAPAGPTGTERFVPTADGGFALAWQSEITAPGGYVFRTSQVELFNADAQPLGSPLTLSAVAPFAPAPDISRISALPGSGVLVPRVSLGPAGQMQEDWLPLGNPAYPSSVPVGEMLPVGTEMRGLAGGGFAALTPAGELQLLDNEGRLRTSTTLSGGPSRLEALAGGGFAIGSGNTVQAYDPMAAPVGPAVQVQLPQSSDMLVTSPLTAGGLVEAQTSAGNALLDVLVPANAN